MGLFSICTSASDFAHLVHVTARLVIKPDGNKIHYTYGNGSNPTKDEWLVSVPAVCSGRHERGLYRYLADCSYCTSRKSEVGRECFGRIQEPALLKTQVGGLNLALPLFCKNEFRVLRVSLLSMEKRNYVGILFYCSRISKMMQFWAFAFGPPIQLGQK